MADAWTNLLEHSSLTSGDAWEHLLAQEGGGGTPIYMDRYISDKAIKFNINLKSTNFKIEAQKQFDVLQNDLDFTKENTRLTTVYKQVDVVFEIVKVID